MDPNITLAEIRARTAEADAAYAAGDEDSWAACSAEVKNLVADLDAWLSRGGFWPSAWNPNGGATCGRCAS